MKQEFLIHIKLRT